jgi:hypothetical protein
MRSILELSQLKKISWNQRQREFMQDSLMLRELSDDDPERQRFLEEMVERHDRALYEEDLADFPEWVEATREREQKNRKLEPRRKRLINAIRKEAEKQGAHEFGDSMEIYSDPAVTRVSFVFWYQTDKDLAADQDSGRHDALSAILQGIADRVARAPSEVTFHSRQFVNEKLGGDLRKYLG